MYEPPHHEVVQPPLWVFLFALALILLLSPPANPAMPALVIAH